MPGTLTGVLEVLADGTFGRGGQLSIIIERTILMCPFDRVLLFNKQNMFRCKIKTLKFINIINFIVIRKMVKTCGRSFL